MKDNRHSKFIIILAVTAAVLASGLTLLFLNGQFIEIPKGTPQGGIISAIGSLFITVGISVVVFMAILLYKKMPLIQKQFKFRE